MNVQISEQAEKDFKNFVVTKYGKLKGTLSSEVEKALLHYITCPETKSAGVTMRENQREKEEEAN